VPVEPFLSPGEESKMTSVRRALLASALMLAACTVAALAQPAPTPAAKGAVTMPAPPDPVPVTVKAANTALLVFDMIDPICSTQPKCVETMVPAISSLLAKARSAGIFVLYATREPGSKWLPPVAPATSDALMRTFGQDRFYNTELDKILKDKGITTLILTGWRINGSVTYTSVGATLRGYTVVVPADASLAATDYDTAIGIYQILTQLDANATNAPLKTKASTLSRTDLITIN
jgi:nicotinamidase-related amidase